MERIIQIINHVMKGYLRHETNTYSKQQLTRELIELGYDPDDIDTAFQSLYAVPLYLCDQPQLPPEVYQFKQGQRVFCRAEQQKLSLTFQGEIVRLANSALLSMNEVELVLWEAMQLEAAEVGLKELVMIIHKIIREEERILLMLPYKTDMSVAFLVN